MQIEGRNPVLETLKSDTKVNLVLVQSRSVNAPRIREIISAARKKGIRVRKVGRNKLDKMSKTKNHQGVIAQVRRELKSLIEILDELLQADKQPFFVLINEVHHQQNLGAIIRTAECAGCSGVIIPSKTKITAEITRASMGATEHIPIIQENIFNAIKLLKKNAIKIVGLEATGTKTIYEGDLRGSIALIIGGEHSGITKSLLTKCDIVLKIPLFGKINSLNMSNAAAIALFEKIRQGLTSLN
jgi:23S rRNA (guanosine2251-2'-O)-methyltransferase